MLILLWIAFILVVLMLMALDLGALHRKAHVIGIREAVIRTAGWVGLAIAFDVAVYFIYTHDWLGVAHHLRDDAGNLPPNVGWVAVWEFLTGYIVEQSLSMDNMMIFALIFGYFRVPLSQQHRVPCWRLIGALGLRGFVTAAGAAPRHH